MTKFCNFWKDVHMVSILVTAFLLSAALELMAEALVLLFESHYIVNNLQADRRHRHRHFGRTPRVVSAAYCMGCLCKPPVCHRPDPAHWLILHRKRKQRCIKIAPCCMFIFSQRGREKALRSRLLANFSVFLAVFSLFFHLFSLIDLYISTVLFFTNNNFSKFRIFLLTLSD